MQHRTKQLLEIEIDRIQAMRPLMHAWPTAVGPGKCLAIWQQGPDGRMYAECPHFRYVVKEGA